MSTAKILNQLDDNKYRSSYPPTMVGVGNHEAAQEIHIFLAKLNPNPLELQRYKNAVNEWNEIFFREDNQYTMTRMKACHLALIYRDPINGEDNEICVMQTSRYVFCNNPEIVINECHNDAKWFSSKKHGFDVIREKIEVRAFGLTGIPINDVDTNKYNTKYFEFHIRVGRKDDIYVNDNNLREIEMDEINELKKISSYYSDLYCIPIPLSFNKHKGYQRYLNMRFRNMGRNNAMNKVETVANQIEQNTKYKIIKIIPEYVWYDSYTQLDRGWIDYTQKELDLMFAKKNRKKRNIQSKL